MESHSPSKERRMETSGNKHIDNDDSEEDSINRSPTYSLPGLHVLANGPLSTKTHRELLEETDVGESKETSLLNTAKCQSDQPSEHADVLYCLSIESDGQPRRHFYQEHRWKGINDGLSRFDDDQLDIKKDTDTNVILIYTAKASVADLTQKKGQTLSTWRDEPSSFEFKKDGHLIRTNVPQLTILSGRITRVLQSLMDYYPKHLGPYNMFSFYKNTIPEIMHYYGELKAYIQPYLLSRTSQLDNVSKVDIGNCGDEKIAKEIQQQLDFGSLDVAKDPCDEATAHDLAVLLRTLAPMYKENVVPVMSSLFLDDKPRITYESIWLLLKPGAYLYVHEPAFAGDPPHMMRTDRHRFIEAAGFTDDNQLMAWVVSSWNYVQQVQQRKDLPQPAVVEHLKIYLWSILYDGYSFQRIRRDFTIHPFEGLKLISSLGVTPVHLRDRLDNGDLRRRLEKRGRKYISILNESIDKVAHREYINALSGYHGQIIVDPVAYRQYKKEDDSHPGWVHGTAYFVSIADGDGGRKFRNLIDYQPSNIEHFTGVEDIYVFLPRRMEGLGLKTKRWMVFEIDNISETRPKSSPHQLDTELVLISDDDKESLRTILPKGERPVSVVSDFIPGKGEGKVFLLYGPPGTGKTLTVECVANDTRRPLISLTAQDVNLDDSDVESHLRIWFAVAAKWDAILLIDEADLFLEQRRVGDSERNRLATIFLRSLEYYKGILFLTTNRPGHIDDSFISRITCPIAYKPLSAESKAKIVGKFIRKFEETDTIEVDNAAAKFLIENCEKLNGRQIRNILHSAVALAEAQQRSEHRLAAATNGPDAVQQHVPDVVSVKRHHVKSAVSRQVEFMSYLESLKGRDEPSRARSRQDYLSVV